MNRTQKADEQLAALASHLSLRREAILQAWREAVTADRELSAPSSLPRTQFNDHIPELLDAFEKSLRNCSHRERIATTEEEKEDAAGHGLQRWQQGYHLREVTREWGHLQLCLVTELEEYSTTHYDLEPSTMPAAWRRWPHCAVKVSARVPLNISISNRSRPKDTSVTWSKLWTKCAHLMTDE